MERSLTRCLSICIDAYDRRDTKDLPTKHGRQQMTVYGELDATKLREQEALAKLDAVTAEIEKLKALLAQRQS